MKIIIETSSRIDDRSGREIIIFTPVVTFVPFASGELRFARWEVWADASEKDRALAGQCALRSAKEAISAMAKENKKGN